MNNVALHIGQFAITWAQALVIAGAAQWLLFAAISMLSRSPAPKQGMRGQEKVLIGSSVAFLAFWLVGFDARSLLQSSKRVDEAAMVHSNAGSCASLSKDMSSNEVKSRMGDPDERRPDEEARGPGATIWIYRDSRCAVHLFGDKVDFID